MPLNQQLRRLIGMTIEIPQRWEDDEAASNCSVFGKGSVTEQQQWDNDYSTGSSTKDSVGVSFREDNNVYYDSSRSRRSSGTAKDDDDPRDLWFTSKEIAQFRRQAIAESSAQEQNLSDNHIRSAVTVLEYAY